MKRFQFRFEAVENLRRIELENQVKELAKVQRKAQQIEAQIEEYNNQLMAELVRLRSSDGLDVLDNEMRQLSEAFRKATRASIAAAQQEHIKALHEVEKERQKVVEKQKKKKAMERLREREEEKYYAEVRRKENQDMDEVASNLFAYRDMGPSKS